MDKQGVGSAIYNALRVIFVYSLECHKVRIKRTRGKVCTLQRVFRHDFHIGVDDTEFSLTLFQNVILPIICDSSSSMMLLYRPESSS